MVEEKLMGSGPPVTVAQHRARLKRVEFDGHGMTYVDEGPRDGRAIALVHGMPTSSWLWRKVIPRLSAEGFRVIAPDLLGFSGSDKPTEPAEYGLERQAGRIIGLMDRLGIGRWTQVAHDLGGPWTWELIDRATDRIEGLVILNTSAYREGFKPPLMVKMMASPLGSLMLSLMAGGFLGPAMVGAFFRTYTGDSTVIDREAVEGYWLPLHEGTTRPFRQFVGNFSHLYAQFDRYHEAFRRLKAPASIIWGNRDRVSNAALLAPQFAADLRIPQESIHILEDANHFLQEDGAAEVAELIAKFMRA